MPRSARREQQITAMYQTHDTYLQRVVRRVVAAQQDTAADACAHAWAQLLSADYIDLDTRATSARAWLCTVAVNEARRLTAIERRATPRDEGALDALSAQQGLAVPSPDHTARLHARLDLVDEIPERPRRFLLRVALGYSYCEIAAAEGVTYTTTNRLISNARRILRELDADEGGEYRAPGP